VATDETMIHTVARTVGSAIGIVASNAAKVVGGSDNAKTHKGEAAPNWHASSGRSAGQRLENRSTNKKKKRAAHKRKLRRSHTIRLTRCMNRKP